MKVVILAGGYGTRLSEYTELIPKPMVTIGNYPILMHILNIYTQCGYREFYIALGYKLEIIIKYFKSVGETVFENDDIITCKLQFSNQTSTVHLVDTGKETMTGGRIKRLSKYLKDENFMVTYGDGLADINLNELEKFHKNHGKIATITAVQPPARFGGLELDGDKVLSFREKSILDQSWINGGFFIFKKKFIESIEDDQTFLERFPLENIASIDQLRAFKHSGFWQCMDTKRDRDYIQEVYNKDIIDVFLK